jgi:hypothetical protein
MHLTIVIVPPLISTSEQGHLQKTTAICACLLWLVHRIFCRPSAPLGDPNIAQTVEV